MKKLMRIALVFALAGAALVGCTKDYSGDISDLNKKVSEQATALSALQTQVGAAQTAADAAAQKAAEALAEAQKKATPADVQAAEERVNAKINDLVNGDVKALKEAVAALEGIKADERLTALETAIKDFVTKAELAQELAALKEELEATIAAGDKANADAIADLTKQVNELLARPYGEFSVAAIEETATFAFAVWAPQTDKQHVGWYNKLAEEFPELSEIKKDDAITMFGALPFIVNPSSTVLDDSYAFSLVSKSGIDSGIELGNPTEGYSVKAGSNVWNVEVQSPAYVAGKATFGYFEDLSLVVENADGISAQTAFAYSVYAYQNESEIFNLGTPKFEDVQYHDEAYFDGDVIDLDDLGVIDTQDKGYYSHRRHRWIRTKESAPLYENYFIVEATDEAQIEKYGVSVDGTKVTIAKGPEASDSWIKLNFTITAIGVNGKTDQKDFVLVILPAAVETNADLGTKAITLGYNAKGEAIVPVVYNFADFEYTAAQKEAVYNALKKNNTTVTVENANPSKLDAAVSTLFFLQANGQPATSYANAATFGFNVMSDETIPGNYVVKITTKKGEFAGEGTLTVSNPEACPVHLAEALCDADGVLQIVGDVEDGFITYNLNNAIIAKDGAEILVTSFVDEDMEYSDDDPWISEDGKKFQIPVQNGSWKTGAPAVKLLYTPRNFSVTFNWFKNPANPGVFEFKAEAVSAIYDEAGEGANITIDATKTTAYFTPGKDESNKIDLTKVLKSGKYVAGELKGTEFNGFYYSAAVAEKSETKDGQINYSDPKTETATLSIVNPLTSNLSAGTKYVVNAAGKFVEMPLDDARAMNLISASEFAAYSVLPTFKFYISQDDWKNKIFGTWDTYYYSKQIKDGKNVCADPEAVKALTGSEKERVEKFTTYAALIDFNKSLDGVTIITSGKPAVKRSYGLAADPTFEFDTVEYGPYVVLPFDGKTITADATKAGQSDVTIPVTAKIKDIWGMTTKKTFNVVFKVK